MRIPTYDQRVVPQGSQEQVFRSDVLRESAKQIPETSATARAKQGFAHTLGQVAVDMKDAYDAKQLADAQTNLGEQYAALEARMKSPEYKGENHWETWGDYYDKRSKEINDSVAKQYKTIGGQARNNIKNTGARYKTQYGVGVSNSALGAQLDELEGAINIHTKKETDLAIAAYINGSMNALAETTKRFTSYLAGQVKAGVLTEAEAKSKVGQMESNIMTGIWDYRVVEQPGQAYKELRQMEKNYLKAAKAGDTEAMGFYGMNLNKIEKYKSEAKRTMLSILEQDDKARKSAQAAAEKANKKRQNSNARGWYVKAQNNVWNKGDLITLDKQFMAGDISEDDYKSVRSLSRTGATKFSPEQLLKEAGIRAGALEAIANGQPINRDQLDKQLESGQIRAEKYIGLVQKNASTQYSVGSKYITNSLRPGAAVAGDEADIAKRKWSKALLVYDAMMDQRSANIKYNEGNPISPRKIYNPKELANIVVMKNANPVKYNEANLFQSEKAKNMADAAKVAYDTEKERIKQAIKDEEISAKDRSKHIRTAITAYNSALDKAMIQEVLDFKEKSLLDDYQDIFNAMSPAEIEAEITTIEGIEKKLDEMEDEVDEAIRKSLQH